MAGDLSDRIVGAESGGDATARNPRSSATGAGQFIDSTWLDMVGKYRPDLAGLPRDQVLALRTDPALSREMVGRYADENGAKLRAAGLPDNDGNRYLSHFAGPAGARAVLSADPVTPVAQVLQPGQVAANPFVRSMTAGQLTDWAARKVGGSAPMRVPGAPAGSAAFGLSGPTPAGAAGSTLPAGGTTMATPAGAGADAGPDMADLLRRLVGGETAPAQPAAAAPAPAPAPFGFAAPVPAQRAPKALTFDLAAYLAQLARRPAR